MLNSVFQSNSTLGNNTCWAGIALPYSASQQYNLLTFIDAVGNRYPAVKHRDIGIQSCLFYVSGTWPNANTTTSGYFITPSSTDLTNFNALGLSAFTLTNYLLDRPLDIIPKVSYTFSDGTTTKHWVGQTSKAVANSSACLEYQVVEHGTSGMMTNIWLDIFNKQDVVPFKLCGVWSNPNDPSWGNFNVQSISLESRCPFYIHWAASKNISNPTYNSSTKKYSTQILGNTNFVDGQGYEIEGVILGTPYAYNWGVDTTIPASRNNTLSAFYSGSSTYGGIGEVYGICRELNVNNDWDVWGKLPKTPVNQNIYKSPTAYPSDPFAATGMFGLRNFGNLKDQGTAGDQEDFGHIKGYQAIVSGNCLWIPLMKGGIFTSLYRPISHYENTGQVAKYINHTGAQTYMSQIWTAGGGITDWLGKNNSVSPGDGTGGTSWKAISDQHVSHNGLITYYALTGDRLAEQILKHLSEADFWMVSCWTWPAGQNAVNYGNNTASIGRWTAERAVGRSLLAACRRYKVMDETYRPRLKAWILSRCNDYYTKIWRGRLLPADRQWAASESLIISGASTQVSSADGTSSGVWAWHPFESAIVGAGMYAVYKSFGDPSALMIARNKSDMCVSAAMYYEASSNSYHVPVYLHYRTGLSLPENSLKGDASAPEEGLLLDTSAYIPIAGHNIWGVNDTDGSPPGVSATKSNQVSYFNESIAEWVYPMAALAYQITNNSAIRTKALAAMQYYYPTAASNWKQSEWLVAENLPY